MSAGAYSGWRAAVQRFAYRPGAALAYLLLLMLIAIPAGGALAQTAFNSDFDHMTTGWTLEGSHRNVECASCHVGGIFQGTARQCAACHSLAGRVKATPPPLTHIRTTEECDACHRETGWQYIQTVDHNAVIGECRGCHNSQTATGKPPRHIPTSSDCDVCHRTTGWSPAG
jgi:hypothetical protein